MTWGALADDSDGLIVAESSDVDSHHGLVVVVEAFVDCGFDEPECDESVVGFVGEFAENSDLVGGGLDSSLVCDVLRPFGGCDAGWMIVGASGDALFLAAVV